jgi:KUP system potassium uptake protein
MTSLSIDSARPNRARLLLALGALGVVYGDIGTSPIYALRETLHSAGGEAQWATVAGCLSLMFWLIMIVVSFKYAGLILRANNDGQGGMLALVALSLQKVAQSRYRRVLLILGVAGTALFFGDAVITPAISVLSAVEGLEVKAPGLVDYIKPITLGIVIGLFLVQSHGTGVVGRFFGPIVLAWFAVLAALGLRQIVEMPMILTAINPLYAIEFVANHDASTLFAVMGSVLLAVTGGEALYADLGHFGRRAIQLSWYAIVLPASLLNYFGQGVLVLNDPAALASPFFIMAPDALLLPLILLTTAATVIASQAVISGTFSLGYQAVRLGMLPRLDVKHTSSEHAGQIYVPQLNWMLMICVVFLIITFDSSGALANAYGVAVTGTMLVNTIVASVVARHHWQWSLARVGLVFGTLAGIEGMLLASSLHKVLDGGWFPLLLGAAVSAVMASWLLGRAALVRNRGASALEDADFVAALSDRHLLRVPGIAVFLTGDSTHVPSSLLHNMRHNRVLHRQVVLTSVITEGVPIVADSARVELAPRGQGVYRLIIRYGFAEEPDLIQALMLVKSDELRLLPDEVSFFIGRERVLPRSKALLPRWCRWLFIWMSNQESSAADYFRLPTGRIIELGQRSEI